MSVEIVKNSRLKFHNLREINGIEFWADDNEPNIEVSDLDDVDVLNDNRLDLIAWKKYRDPVLWWVICKNNGLYNFDDINEYKVSWIENNIEKNRLIVGEYKMKLFVEKLKSLGYDVTVERKVKNIRVPNNKRVFMEIL